MYVILELDKILALSTNPEIRVDLYTFITGIKCAGRYKNDPSQNSEGNNFIIRLVSRYLYRDKMK